MVALTGLLWARSAFGADGTVPVEVRVDLRADRAATAPTIRVAHAAAHDGADEILCFDDGSEGDSVASDRLWLCRGTVTGKGAGRITLVAGAGGTSERVIETVAVALVPGRKLRWTWNAGAQTWPADERGASPLGGLEVLRPEPGDALPSAPDIGLGVPGSSPGGDGEQQGGGPPGHPGGPGGQGGLSRYFSLAVAYAAPTRSAPIPSRLRSPDWRAAFGLLSAIAAMVGARAVWRAVSMRLAGA